MFATIRIRAQNSSTSSKSSPNVALIVALVVVAVVLITGILVAVLILKRRRSQFSTLDHEHEPFTAKTGRVLDKPYPGHHKATSESLGPLLQVRAATLDLPFQDHIYGGGGGGTVEDQELGLRTQSGPIDLWLSAPRSAPTPPPTRSDPLKVKVEYLRPLPVAPLPVSPISPGLSESEAESLYPDERSESARTRIRTADFAALFPSVPPLSEDLQLRLKETPLLRGNTAAASSSAATATRTVASHPLPQPIPAQYIHPHSDLSPETPPLAREDTLAVANILKTHAKRRGNEPQPSRSMSRTPRIERVDFMIEAPTPVSPYAQEVGAPSRRSTSQGRPPLPTHSGTVDTVDDTLQYYTSQPSPVPNDVPPRMRIL
ncbi:hypothetical protein K438DRAFT_1960342 [Mycena galopus ATCC 62051]|nr:hypothetical protein K438DRAFT_1960342 [Mycena galopus ATCC 62051]